jgi:hypothetical protein
MLRCYMCVRVCMLEWGSHFFVGNACHSMLYLYSGFHHAPGTGWATPQGTAARGKSAGRGRGAIFTPQKIRGTPLKFSESRYFAQLLCRRVLQKYNLSLIINVTRTRPHTARRSTTHKQRPAHGKNGQINGRAGRRWRTRRAALALLEVRWRSRNSDRSETELERSVCSWWYCSTESEVTGNRRKLRRREAAR